MTFDDMDKHWESILAGDIEPNADVLPDDIVEEIDKFLAQFLKPVVATKHGTAGKRKVTKPKKRC